MASKLSFVRRQQLITSKQGRSRRLLLEHLEDRLSPAANLLVTTSIAVTEQVLREFTPSGDLVRTASLPGGGAYEPGRDLIYDQSGKVHAYLGTFDPALGSYTLAGGGWTERTHSGWSTVNNVSNGGIGQWGDFVYVTDMTTFGAPADIAKGVVRFNLADGTSARFLETEEPQDLAIGHDGKLYLLSGGTVKSYDRETFQPLGTVTLPAGDFRGIAVNMTGEIFAVNFSEQVYRLSSSGEVLGMVTLSGVSDPMDIDLSGDGRVAIGTASGHVVQLSEDLTGLATFAAGTQRAFVAFGPDETQSPAGPTPPTATITSDAALAEGNSGTSHMVFTVTLSAPSVDPVVFKYSVTGITATPLSDFWPTNHETRVVPPGQTSVQLLVPILGDTTFENDETFTLTLSDPVGVLFDDSTAVGTITNDDSSTPSFVVDDYIDFERGQFIGTTFAFVVRLTTPNTQTVTVAYATRNGTATGGSDYQPRSGTLTFIPGQLEQTVDVTVFGDVAAEPDETFFFELSNASGAEVLDAQAIGTIVNDDLLYKLSMNNAFGFEGHAGPAPLDFTITLNQASTETIAVDYFTFGADATNNVDFAQSAGTAVFAPGETSQTISIPIVGDTEIEPNEQFYLVLQNPIGAGLENECAMGTIGNDDSTPGNNAPIATGEAYETSEDYPLSVNGFGILANDYDPDGDFLQAFLVSGPAHGEMFVGEGGSFYYIPDDDYFGPDSFVYRATDTGGLSSLATVSLTVWGMDDPIHLAAPGPQTTAEDTPLTFSWTSENPISITDIESPRVMVSLLVQNGILTLPTIEGLEFPYPESANNNQSITFYADSPDIANAALDGLIYTPEQDFNGSTWLDVMVTDVTGVYYYQPSAYTSVPITVTAVNDAPVAADDYYEAYEDYPLIFSGLSLMWNDNDVDGGVIEVVIQSGPAHGTLTNQNGSYTYTPAPNYNGPDSFTYRLIDEGGLSSAPATVSLTVFPMDDLVQATAPAAQTIAEDTTITFSVANGNAFTISDPESPRVLVDLLVQDGILTLPSTAGLEFPNPASVNNSFSITFYADSPAEANAALDGLVYTPNANFHGQTYVTLLVRDTTILYPPVDAFAYTQITITPVNDTPVATDDFYAAEAGAPFFATLGGGGSGLGVLMNDQDVDMELLTAVLVSGPAHGTLVFHPDGTFMYTADATYSGTDSFTYRASDGQAESNLATATFTITLNLPPVSVGDSYAVNEDSSLSIAAPGVLANDSDPNGQPLTAQLVSGAAHGTLTLNPSGSFTYTPAANYSGPDEFWYRASDGTNLGDAVAVTLTVNPVNDAPVAASDSYSVDEDGVLTIVAPGVLSNDVDADSATLTASLVSGPSHGVVTLNADGSFTYTPTENYFGTDSFTYRASDGPANSNVATVALTVNAVNDAPLAVNDAYSLNEDQTLTIASVLGVTSLTMVSEPGDYIGQGLSYSFTPQTGTFMANRNFDNGVSVFYSGGGQSWNLRFAAPFDVDLTPGHYPNATRFPFQATGVPGLSVTGNGRGSNTLTGNFTVTEAVYAADGDVLRFAATFEQHSEGFAPALTGTINIDQGGGDSGVLVNDSDVEGSPLTIIVVATPEHGTLSLNVDGSFAYTPVANYHGADSFSYKLTDGTSESNVATVSLTVNPVNDFPTAIADSYTVAEDGVLSVAAPGVLANDFDVDGNSLTATLVTSPTHGSLAFNADGSFTYTPQANYHGPDSFQYAARDGSSFSFIRTVTLDVTSVNDTPVADAGPDQTAAEGSAVSFTSATSDTDGDTLGYLWNFGDGATATDAAPTHAFADHGVYTITLTVSDGQGGMTSDSLVVTVYNVAPTASLSGPATGARGQERIFALGAADPSATDQAGAFAFHIDWGDGSTQSSSGPASQQLSHTFTAVGTFTVQATATDQGGGVSTTTQHTITVSAVDLQAGTLVIGGTTADDSITVAPTNSTGTLAVTINGVSHGTFASPEQIVIYGQAGNDQLKLNTKKIGPTTYYVTVPAAIFGDAGNDTLDARDSSAHNILVGGAGTDSLLGGSGRELLLGGLGADTLRASGGDDLLIGNVTDFDSNLDALIALLAEWHRTDAGYQTRIDHLSGSAGGGLNGGYFLSSDKVHDDAAIDQLDGDAGTDWFFYTANGSNKDRLNDLVTGEVATAQ